MRAQQQSESYHLTIAEDQTKNQPKSEIKQVRHIYLQQQNIYGRFIPYLLLKDQLESQVDSSGNTALHHMCSHNSPYLPLFLSSIPDNDPILNKKSKLGHTPLDVAGLYCSRQYIDLIRSKGAIDSGNVDYWAIQGGNLANWSGKVYVDKKPLIHWAAYNDMPDVIAEYAKQGISVSDPDSNGLTPVDLTVLNKSYNSLRVLTDLGQRPKPQILKSSDSKSIKQHFNNLSESSATKTMKRMLKTFSLVIFIVLCLFLNMQTTTMILAISIMLTMNFIMLKPTKIQRYMDNNRKTQFISQLLMGKIINRRNHISYLLLHITIIACGINAIYQSQITNHLQALIILIISAFIGTYFIHFCIQIYGICKNLTYQQMLYSYRWNHLWEKVKYIQERKIVVRFFMNPDDKGIWQNFKDYFWY